LAFIERRLLLAKELLNPADSVLIVTIDEKEYLRLGLLLEQSFPEAEIEMVTSVVSSKGVARFGEFSRVEEYIFTVRLGAQEVALSEGNMLDGSRSATAKVGKPVDWLGLRRREPSARRGARPKQFYPVFVDSKTGYIHSIGDEITNVSIARRFGNRKARLQSGHSFRTELRGCGELLLTRLAPISLGVTSAPGTTNLILSPWLSSIYLAGRWLP